MKISRRSLLVTGGVLGGGFLIGVAGVGLHINAYNPRDLQQSVLSNGAVKVVAQWITISPDGQVTILSPHTEMGQGAQTSLLQIVLDELDADPGRTIIQMAPASPAFTHSDAMSGFILGQTEMSDWARQFVDKTFGRACMMRQVQFTGGSTAIRFTGWRGLRRAAAAAREMLAQAGAEALGVPLGSVRTADSTVWHDASGRNIGYGALAPVVSEMDVPVSPAYKDPSERRFIGTRFPRVDIPDKVFAQAVYGIDVELPGMRYAAVAPPPITRGTITAIRNQSAVEAMSGVEAVLLLGDVVAVVADNPWRAEQAARKVDMACQPPEGGVLDEVAFRQAQWSTVRGGELDVVYSQGDVQEALASGEAVAAEYAAPYLAHAPMEPMNATIWEEDGVVHVASGVQGPLAARAHVAEVLGMPMEMVQFHAHTMGGGFGRRSALSADNLSWLRHTAAIYQAVGGAIKLTWSREAGIRLGTFRPSDVASMRARLGPDGRPIAWHARMFAAVLGAKDATPHYNIPNILIESAYADPLLPYSYWRSVDASTHGFFIESFIDELARAADQDPVDYRLSLLDADSRHARVLRRVAEISGWGQARAPEEGALGVALFASFGSIVAQVAAVSMEGGRPRVHQVWCVIDCGTAVNPGSVEAQMQGGIHFGLSAALYGEITLKDGLIRQSNFHDYRAVRFVDAPRIEVDILSSPEAPLGGAGEPGTPPIAPAVANAIAALEARPRNLPLTS